MSAKRILPPIALLLGWQLLSTSGMIPAFKLPSPAQVAAGLVELLTTGMPPGHPLHLHIFYSLQRVFFGYAIALATAIPLGLLMGWSRTASALFAPLVEMVRPIPPLAWIPLSILWFGIGIKSAAFIIFLGAFFPILLNTINGVRSIEPVLIEAAQMLNANRRFFFLRVLVPGALPAILTGMRIGIGVGWMSLVAAEFTGVREGYGLGYMIMTARDIQRSDEIIAGMLVIGAIGFSIDTLLQRAEKHLTRWR
jgi:ABC-type nitrate/sulfonate/bicarbonate transport system permease component